MKPDELDPLKRKNPFVDETGKNPFSDNAADDELTTPDEVGEPYAAPNTAGGKTYAPNEFVATAPHRGGFVMTIAVCGAILAPTAFCCPIFSLGGGVLSVMAIALASSDLKAMKSGAMDQEGRSSTKWAYIIGLIGLLLCAITLVFSVTFTIMQIIGDWA